MNKSKDMSEKKITGYKGFDKEFYCRGKKYEVGKKFQQNGELEMCGNGIHFCEMPLDVFNYYPPEPGNQYAEVESFGGSVKGDDKVCVRGIKVKSKISIAGLFKAHFDIIVSKIKETVKESSDTMNTAGYKAHANTAG